MCPGFRLQHNKSPLAAVMPYDTDVWSIRRCPRAAPCGRIAPHPRFKAAQLLCTPYEAGPNIPAQARVRILDPRDLTGAPASRRCGSWLASPTGDGEDAGLDSEGMLVDMEIIAVGVYR